MSFEKQITRTWKLFPMNSNSWYAAFSSELIRIFECYFIIFMFLTHVGHLIERDIDTLTYSNTEAEILLLPNSPYVICSLQFVIPQTSQSAEMWVSWLFVGGGDTFSDTTYHSTIAVPHQNQPTTKKKLTRSNDLTVPLLPDTPPI